MATTDSLDTILSSLHDLENVKTVNEDLLRKEIDQRKTIEMQVQKAMEELRIETAHNSELLYKEQTSLHALMKLKEQIKHLENLNQDKNKRIEELNSQIITEEEKQQRNLTNFERIMAELANTFRSGVNLYSEERLDQNITALTKGIKELNTKETIETTNKEWETSIGAEQQSIALRVFTEEYKVCKEEKVRMETMEKQLEENIQRLEAELMCLKKYIKE